MATSPASASGHASASEPAGVERKKRISAVMSHDSLLAGTLNSRAKIALLMPHETVRSSREKIWRMPLTESIPRNPNATESVAIAASPYSTTRYMVIRLRKPSIRRIGMRRKRGQVTL